MPGVLGIDRSKGVERSAGSHKLIDAVGAIRHACVFHLKHPKAMPQAVIACLDTMRGGFFKRLIFRRMHVFFHLRIVVRRRGSRDKSASSGNEFTTVHGLSSKYASNAPLPDGSSAALGIAYIVRLWR